MFKKIFSEIGGTVAKNHGAKNYATKASFNIKPFKLHNLSSGPSTTVEVTKEDALEMYRQMQVCRQLETSVQNLYNDGLVSGFCHLNTGQEASSVGMKAAMRPQDNVAAAYRLHGWLHLMGATPASVLCELTGKQGGCSRGKGGSVHIYERNFYGGNGIVGAQCSMGPGVALACKYKGDGGVCLTVYGDGASNQGQLFEAFNMAYLWKLPCIFICENNRIGMGTIVERSSSNTEYFRRGDVLPGIWMDGMDVLAVRKGFEFAIEHAVQTGPLVVEVETYRFSGHSASDPATNYRAREDLENVRQNLDPIIQLKKRMLSSGLATDAEIRQIDVGSKKIIDEATKTAIANEVASLSELYTDIYSKNMEPAIRGRLPSELHEHSSLKKAINM